MGHDRTTRRRDVAGGRSEVARAIQRAFVPGRAKRDITDPPLRGRAQKPATEAREEAGTPSRKRGPTKQERALSVLGESGRARARVGAIPRGKKGTHAKRNTGRTKPHQSAKPVRGSPSAKRRIQNRRRAS